MFKTVLKIVIPILAVALCIGIILAVFNVPGSTPTKDKGKGNDNDDGNDSGNDNDKTKYTSYTVTFDSNGGSSIDSQSVLKDQYVSVPGIPVHDELFFAGWYADKKLTQEYDFSTPVTSDITLYAKWTNLYLKVSDYEFFAGESGTVYFYVETSEDVENVYLKDAEDGDLVTELKDDGQYEESGDDLPQDNIFSGKLTLFSDSATTYTYYATTKSDDGITSQIVSIQFINKLTTEELNDIDTVDARIQSELFESGSYDEMSLKERKKKASSILKDLEKEGLIVEDSIIYDAESYCYSFIYKSGVHGAVIFQNWETVTDETEDSNAPNGVSLVTTAVTNSSELTLDLGDAIILWSFDQAWDRESFRKPFYEDVEERWDSVGLETTVVWDTTVEDYKNLSGYKVILFSGHGAYMTYSYNGNNKTCSSLLLHQESSVSQNREYSADLSQFRVGLCSVYGGTMYAILPAFFDYYYDWGDLDGSFVFAENCEFRGTGGRENAEMPNALRSASAEAVVGFHNSVMATYSRDLGTYFVDCLIEGMSAGDAYDAALEKHGEDDSDSRSDGDPAYPLFAGERESYLVKDGLENGSFETASGIKPWSQTGDVRVLTKLGELIPVHQKRMAILTTGIGSAEQAYLEGTEGSVLSQAFKMPKNATTLTFSYDMVSEEPLEYVGTKYDDTFVVRLITANETIEIATNTINTAEWISIDGIDFSGGDQTTYHTEWIDVSFDVSAYAGQVVTLEFVVYDKGDSVYDTAVLVDNIVLN